jgi:hypothetical protein
MERSTDVINAARIRVAGIGGLGLLAMALVVAINVPRIGLTLAAGALAGVALAAVLIVLRRKAGPRPTSGGRPGANTVLAIDDRQSVALPESNGSIGKVCGPCSVQTA